MSNKAKGNIALLITALIWGSGFIAQKLGMAYLEPFTFNGLRQCIASIILVPLMIHTARTSGLYSRKKSSAEEVERRKRDLLAGSIICGILMALGTNLQQIGLVTVSAGKSGFITAIYIVLVPLIGILVGERSSIKTWICIIMAMIGFGFLSLKGDMEGTSIGDWLTLLSAVFFSMQIVAVSRYVTKSNAIILSTMQMMISGILSIICMFLFETPTMEALHSSAVPLLYSSIVPTAIGFTLQIVGQKYTSPAVASLILSLEAVFSAILGVIVLSEHMVLREWFGCVLIFAATILAQLPGRGESPEEP